MSQESRTRGLWRCAVALKAFRRQYARKDKGGNNAQRKNYNKHDVRDDEGLERPGYDRDRRIFRSRTHKESGRGLLRCIGLRV